MKIRMLHTHRGSADGATLETYEVGRVYELGGTQRALDLARVFLDQGWAEEVRAEEQKAVAPAENKAVQAAPENKEAPAKPRRR